MSYETMRNHNTDRWDVVDQATGETVFWHRDLQTAERWMERHAPADDDDNPYPYGEDD